MHEYSIVQALIEQCEHYAHENDANVITKVVIKIGRLSGVEVHLLEVAFDTFKEKTICDGAELVINDQPVVLSCRQCMQQTILDELLYRCGHCQSSDVEVVEGEEMLLMSLEME